MKFAFIRDHRRLWPAAVICRVLKVTRSGFYAWLKRKPSRRALRQRQLLARIRVAPVRAQQLARACAGRNPNATSARSR